MDFLLDKYLFQFLPFNVSKESQDYMRNKAMGLFAWADWACGAQDIRVLIENHTSFLFCEVIFVFLALLTLSHAYRQGGRYMYLWLGIVIHAFNTENLCYWIPDLDNFWQAQSMLTFFGRRAPLYILFGIYSFFDYTASVAAKRLHLPWWAEGPAVGLGAVLLDIPYDIMGPKLLWWTWHDTDPNIFDRTYWAPWTSYYFHCAFACAFTWILKGTRKLLLPEEYDWKLFPREFLCAFLAGTGAFWVGSMQFLPIYHTFHDILGVHTECCTIFFLGLYAIIVWIADRNPKTSKGARVTRFFFDELGIAVLIHYFFFMFLVLWAEPQNIVSTGLHQPIGPCDTTEVAMTLTGYKLYKKKYLCPTRYDEKYFDFHCVPGQKPPKMRDGMPVEWYTICGTPFENHIEYIFVVWAAAILGFLVYFQCLACSGDNPKDKRKAYKKKKE